MEAVFHSVRNDVPRHPNRFWTKVELIATLVQIIAAMAVLKLIVVARDKHPQTPLLIWFIGYTCGCIANLTVISWRFHTFNQDPYADEENNIQVFGGQYSMTRIHKVMEIFEMAVGWFLGYHWFFYNKPSPNDGSILYWLSMGFLGYSCIRYGMFILALYFLCVLLPVEIIRLIIVAIKALYVCISKSNDVEGESDDISCYCCICLENYGEEEEGLTMKLACSHVFHLECIEMWLGIKPTCPLCQSQIDMFQTLLSTNNDIRG